jgi:site-specific recombinase XerD
MATSIYIVLDKRRKKSNGSYPIIFRLVHNRIATTIKSGYSVEEKFWDEKNLKVKRGSKLLPNVAEFNFRLKRKESNYVNKIVELDDKGLLKDISTKELVEILTEHKKNDKSKYFTDFADKIIDELIKEKRIGTAKAYSDALSFLKTYGKKKDITFTEINFRFLEKLEKRYMAVSTNHYNGLAVYLRAIRAIYNRAIGLGLVKESYYPFRRNTFEVNKYHIKTEKTKKRAVSKEIINAIEAFDNGDKSLLKHKYYFLFSFYAMGMNMVDMAKLRKSNIDNGILTYKRSKTKKTYQIKLNNKAWDILNYFGYEKKQRNDLIFPMVKNPENPELVFKQISYTIRGTNNYLKKIAKELNLDVNLTTYVSRHSWATIADKSGIDRRVISQGLGHSDLATTNVYINDIQSFEDLSAANDIITE